MSILRDVIDRILGAPVPTTGAPAVTPVDQEPLTDLTVSALRSMLDEHARGIFLRSGLLCDLIRRDADVMGALLQRLLLMGSYPTEVVGPDDKPTGLAWDAVCPPQVSTDLWCDAVLMGWSLAQLVWRADPADPSRLLPSVVSVHPSAVEHEALTDRWYVTTRSAGRIAVAPGEGQWLLYTPRSARAPWSWGAVNAVAEWYLSNSFAANDARRRSETTGQGLWKAKLPAGARETPDGKSFISKLRTLGRGGVIPIPQGVDAASSYDVELLEAQTDAYAIFQWLTTAGGGKIRLAILGQDLTSQNNTVGTNASSETGVGVLRTIVRADVRAWESAVEAQVLKPLDRYLGTQGSALHVDYSEQADPAATATAQKLRAEAAGAWRQLGVAVDTDALAVEAGIPVRAVEPAPVAAPVSLAAEPDLSPPKGVREACARGVELYEEGHGGDGLVPATVAWARRLAAGEDATRDKLVKMRAWHARHEGDKREGWDSPPTPGYVAFLLWGGEPGRSWSEAMVPRLNARPRKAAAPKLPTVDEIRDRLVTLLRDHVGARAPEIAAAVAGAEGPGDLQRRLDAVAGAPLDPEVVRDVARALILARLAGRAQAQRP